MPRRTTFDLVDRLMDGQLKGWLIAQRAEGLGWDDISRRLYAEFDVDLTGVTLARWARNLGIETDRPPAKKAG